MTTFADTPATRAQAAPAPTLEDETPDLERRFGALRRLYGDAGYARLRAARFAIVGLGGVGSWVAEALARCGVAELVLIDLDHVAESNINRQVQALTSTIGQAKVRALRERIALIHPGCHVRVVEEFVAEDNWPGLLPAHAAGTDDAHDRGGGGSSSASDLNNLPRLDGLIDACDQVRAKEALARWSLASGVPCIVVGAAGGKQRAEAVEVTDLAEVTHDPLLAALRHRLRRAGVIAQHAGAKERKAGLSCVFSREPVAQPRLAARAAAACSAGENGDAASAGTIARDMANDIPGDGTLNCHGYGSSVMVTATFGMVAAGAAVSHLLGPRRTWA